MTRKANRSKARKAAQDLLEASGVLEPPVSLERIAKICDIEIMYSLYQGDTSGLLIYDPDGTKTIGVNTFHSATRQRFTIAHELGHATLHLKSRPVSRPDVVIDKPGEVLFRDELSSQARDPMEIEANAFAADLLMPASMVKQYFVAQVRRRPEATVEDLVETLAKRFEVSAQAMSFRLMNLDLIDPV